MLVNRYVLKSGDISIIVTPEGSGQVGTIALNTAYLLSDNVETLGKIEIKDTDKLIYLCGHGGIKAIDDYEYYTIGGRDIRDIAKILIESGYKGIQTIYITSCDANSIKLIQGKTMVEELKKELSYNLATELTDTNLSSFLLEIDIRSDTNGNSIVVQEGKETVLYVITAEDKIDKGILNLQSLIQNKKEAKVGIDEDLKEANKKYKEKVLKYKTRLLAKEFQYVQYENKILWLSVVLGLILGVVLKGLLYNLDLGSVILIEYEVLIGGILLILGDTINRYLVNGHIEEIYGDKVLMFLILTILKYMILFYLPLSAILRLI